MSIHLFILFVLRSYFALSSLFLSIFLKLLLFKLFILLQLLLLILEQLILLKILDTEVNQSSVWMFGKFRTTNNIWKLNHSMCSKISFLPHLLSLSVSGSSLFIYSFRLIFGYFVKSNFKRHFKLIILSL